MTRIRNGCDVGRNPAVASSTLARASNDNKLNKKEKMMKLRYIDFGGIKPTRGHYDDAGMDCYAREGTPLPKGKNVKIPLGFGIEIPNGYVGLLLPRSSFNAKGFIGRVGVIDSGYRGEICAILANETESDAVIPSGCKISQLVIVPCAIFDWMDSDEIPRGEGGFGSTGS